jgi:hypothetical protein
MSANILLIPMGAFLLLIILLLLLLPYRPISRIYSFGKWILSILFCKRKK